MTLELLYSPKELRDRCLLAYLYMNGSVCSLIKTMTLELIIPLEIHHKSMYRHDESAQNLLGIYMDQCTRDASGHI